MRPENGGFPRARGQYHFTGRSFIFALKYYLLEPSLISYLLPSELVSHFRITNVKELGDLRTKRMILEIYMEEHNVLPPGYSSSQYESKGFLSRSRIQDFPIRGKAVYLLIKRRRWRDKQTGEEIRSDYSFISQGSKLTKELSDFLKGTGTDPGRYP